MSSSTRERIPLTGADCFLRAFDYEARRYHGASHLAQLVIRLGPGFDLDRFRRRLTDIVRAHPVLGAAVRRRWLVGVPTYVAPAADAVVGVCATDIDETTPGFGDIPRVFFERLNQRFLITRGELLHFDICRYNTDGRTDLAMTWAHMLFDASGSEQFISYLAGEADVAAREVSSQTTSTNGFSWRRWATQAERARRWGEEMMSLATPGTASLAGPLRATPQRLRYTIVTLTRQETESVVERSARYAGFMQPTMFYLAAAMRAHAAVFALRGTEPESYLVPLPVRLPHQESGAVVIRTHVSLLWFRVLKEHTRDLGGLVEELKRQRLAQIREHAIENTAEALEFVRLLPLRVYAHMLRRNLRGELASFVFAFTGEFAPELERCAGADVLNGFHVPAVQPSPGSGLIMSLRRGVLNVAHVFQEGVMTDAERALMLEQLRENLLRA